MAVNYPTGLGTVQATKSRQTAADYAMDNPRRGPAYVRKIGPDQPVTWTVSFRFNERDAQRFWAWFVSPTYCDGGKAEFILPLRTEFGMVDHVCRFMPDSLLPMSQEGQTVGYTATITARNLAYPEGYEEGLDFIVELENWEEWASSLDLVMATPIWP